MNNNTSIPAPEKKAPKIPEAEILLNRQLDMAKKNRISDLCILLVFCVIVAGFGILFWIMPDAEYSGLERRALQQFPSMTFERTQKDTERDILEMTLTEAQKTALSKAEINESDRALFPGKTDAEINEMKTLMALPVLADEIGDYYADQFPLRSQLRVLKGVCELGLLKQQNNGIVIASGTTLVEPDTVTGTKTNDAGNTVSRTYKDAAATVEKNVWYLNGVNKLLSGSGIKLSVAVAGRTVDVFEDSMPSIFWYESTHSALYWDAYDTSAQAAGLTTVELKDMLKAHVDAGEYVYYKTDHHWTTLGAYYAYCAVMESLGKTPASLDKFTVEEFSGKFYGTTYAKAGISPSGADTIEFYRFDGDTDYTMTINPGYPDEYTQQGFYNYQYQNVDDKYSAFLGHSNMTDNGGNNAVTIITKNNSDTHREKLILIKDSFGHSLAPLLAYDYDLIILDMRYYNGDMSEFFSDDSVSNMLVIYNMATFSNDTNLSKLLSCTAAHFNTQSEE